MKTHILRTIFILLLIPIFAINSNAQTINEFPVRVVAVDFRFSESDIIKIKQRFHQFQFNFENSNIKLEPVQFIDFKSSLWHWVDGLFTISDAYRIMENFGERCGIVCEEDPRTYLFVTKKTLSYVDEDKVYELAGFGSFPSEIKDVGEDIVITNNSVFINFDLMFNDSRNSLEHEFGHFFGLPHTFAIHSKHEFTANIDDNCSDYKTYLKAIESNFDYLMDQYYPKLKGQDVIFKLDKNWKLQKYIDNCLGRDDIFIPEVAKYNIMNYHDTRYIFTKDQENFMKENAQLPSRARLVNSITKELSLIDKEHVTFSGFVNGNVTNYNRSKLNNRQFLRLQITKDIDRTFRFDNGYQNSFTDQANSTVVVDKLLLIENGKANFDWLRAEVDGTHVYEKPINGVTYKATLASPRPFSSGFDNFSREIVFTYNGNYTEPTHCPAPTNIEVNAYKNLVWDPNSDVDGYEIGISDNGFSDLKTIQTNSFSYYLGNLESCKQYYARVRSVCDGEYGNYSEYVPFTITASASSCSPARDVEIDVNSTSAIIEWNNPTGSSVSDYYVRYRLKNGGSWHSTNLEAGFNTIKILNLKACSDYEIEFKSVCDCASGNWSSKTDFRTKGCPRPTCWDGIKNGLETDIDCGGNCPPCPSEGCSDYQLSDQNLGDCGTVVGTVGSTTKLQWSNHSCPSGYIRIEYSKDFGNTWQILVDKTLDNGEYYIAWEEKHLAKNFRLRYSCYEESDRCHETCDYKVTTGFTSGCTDPKAHNYDFTVSNDNGNCKTCNDGILNGDELGIDCGGSNANCPPCDESKRIRIEGPDCGTNFNYLEDFEIRIYPNNTLCEQINIYESIDNGESWAVIAENIKPDWTYSNGIYRPYHDYSFDAELIGKVRYKFECVNNPTNNIETCDFKITGCGVEPQAVSNPCNAESIQVDNNWYQFSTCGLTLSDVPVPGCQRIGYGDYWLKTIVPSGGKIIVESRSDQISWGNVLAYTGECNNLTFVGTCAVGVEYEKSSQIFENLIPGETIFLRYSVPNLHITSFGDFELKLSEPISCSGESVVWPDDIEVNCVDDISNIDVVESPEILNQCNSCSPPSYEDNLDYTDCAGGTLYRNWIYVDECNKEYSHVQKITINHIELNFDMPEDVILDCSQNYRDENLTGKIMNMQAPCGTTWGEDYIEQINPCTKSGYVIKTTTATPTCGYPISKSQLIRIEGIGCLDSDLADVYYKDLDRDGLGSEQDTIACFRPYGYVYNSLDCDDFDSSIGMSSDGDCSNIVLPLELSYFEVYESTNGAVIEWTLESLENIIGLEIERSRNGKTFEVISTLRIVNSNLLNNSVIDEEFPNFTSVVFYRIKFISQDGSTEYSEIKSLINKFNNKIKINPNPIKSGDQLIISTKDLSTVEFFDLNGKLIFQEQSDASNDIYKINTGFLKAGIYFVLINKKERIKLIVTE